MSRALNNVTAGDDYTAAATLEGVAGGVQVALHVFNAAVVYQLAHGYPGGSWGAERQLSPGFHTLARRATGVRFRAAVPGLATPPQVSAEIADAEEVSWGPDNPPGDFHGQHLVTMTPSGDVLFDFDGHVLARGLDLVIDETNADVAPNEHVVRWLHPDLAKVGVRVYGIHDPGDDRHILRLAASQMDAGDPAHVEVALYDPGDALFAQAILLTDDLRSSFLQSDGVAKRVLRTARVGHNPGSVPANTNAGITVALPAGTGRAGDPFIFGGVSGALTDGVAVTQRQHSLSADDAAPLRISNYTGAAVDAAAADYDFLVLSSV